MDDAQEEMVPGDTEIVDLLPADAQAVFEFRDLFDVLLPGIDEEVNKYVTSNETLITIFIFINNHST